MLTAEQNDFYCRVGPGTPMGEAMRRFWWPILLSSELPDPDSDPVRVKLLGESFVAFRDSDGRPGLLDELCAHRGASLVIGRVEEGDIRCLYHGWKYAVDGRILEAPNVASAAFCERVRQPSHDVVEEAGLVWAYIGPPEHKPLFRRLCWMDLPGSQQSTRGALLPFNYLALAENSIDAPHVTVLHRGSLRQVAQLAEGRQLQLPEMDEVPPHQEIEETDFGFFCAVLRDSVTSEGASSTWARVDALVLPTTAFVPPGFCSMVVPADDVTTMMFTVTFTDGGEAYDQQPLWDALPWLWEQVPGRLLATIKTTAENRYLQDRESLRNGSWAGFPAGLAQEDPALLCSMGSYPTRSMEHIVPADIAITTLRRRLSSLAHQVAEGAELSAPVADTSNIRDREGPVDTTGDWRHLLSAELLKSSPA